MVAVAVGAILVVCGQRSQDADVVEEIPSTHGLHARRVGAVEAVPAGAVALGWGCELSTGPQRPPLPTPTTAPRGVRSPA